MSLLTSGTTHAQSGATKTQSGAEHGARRLAWNERQWRRFDLPEYAATLAVVGAYAYLELGVGSSTESRWNGPILFDERVRSWTRASSRDGRARAGAWSDWLSLAPQGLALFDTVGVPLATDDWNSDVAWQMIAMNFQVYAVVGALSRGGQYLIARARPDREPCLEDREYGELCFRGSYSSFPSGHTSSAFAAAGLICAHHANLPLYGGGAPDVVACAASTTMAAASGALRLVADRHYVSDVIVGALIGFGAGYGLPELLHYTGPSAREPADSASLRIALAPATYADGLGIGMLGWF